MAVDMRARYFGEFDEGAMPPSFSVYPQYELPNSDFMVMPPAAAQAPAQQYLPAVQPMTQEAVAPYDLSALAGLDLSGLYGMNFGTDFGGGAMGGIYPDDPNTEFIAAPLSNKGNATSQTGGNAFEVRVDQPVRLVDHSTNQVVFEGTGYDAARKATELGQGLSDTLGRKANYSIQTADPTGNYSTVAYEKANKSTLGEIANVAGTVLPLAMMAVPGLNVAAGKLLGSQLLGSIALGAGTGGLSAGLKGDNILKGAALGGITAAGGALVPKIQAIGDLGDLARPIGTGIGSTVGNLVTGQNLQNSLLSGVASGALAYATPSIQDAIKGIGQGPSVSAGGGDTSVSYGGPNADIIVNAPAFSTPTIKLGGFKTPAQKAVDELAKTTDPTAATQYADDLINVTGQVPGASTPSINFSGDTTGLPPVRASGLDAVAEPTPEEILVNARETLTPSLNVDLSTIPTGGLSTVTEPTLTPEEILVNARETFTPPVNVDLPTIPTGGLDTVTEPELKEILVNARETLTPSLNVDLSTVPTGALSTVAEPTPTPEEILVNARETLTPSLNVDLSTVPTGALSTVAEPTPTPEEILVKARETFTPPVNVDLSTIPTGGLNTVVADDTIKVTGRRTEPGPSVTVDTTSTTPPGGAVVADDTIKVTGRRTEPGPSVTVDTTSAGDDTKKVGDDTKKDDDKKDDKKLGVDDALALLSLLGGIGGSGGGGGGVPGSQALNPIFSAKLPTPGVGGAFKVGGFDIAPPAARPTTDWYRYATGPAMDIRAGTDLSKATSPYAAFGPGTLGEETFKRVTGMAHGGSMGYARGSSRDSFAVEGPGTGRSDDIPAVLSDGEYVIDAETVALLGDGSSKAGAKKLDEMRVKVRKHKGRNLAKGKFSVNAKRPEKYLSGGRT